MRIFRCRSQSSVRRLSSASAPGGIASKEDILYKALQIDPARMRWCKKTNEKLIEAINRKNRNAYFSLSVTVFRAEAFFCVSAWWLTARQNCMYAFISPAWVVLLKSRNSTVPLVKVECRFSPWYLVSL